MIDRLASEGYRVLAFAYREGEAVLQANEGQLVFVGLAAMMDLITNQIIYQLLVREIGEPEAENLVEQIEKYVTEE